MGVVIDKSRIDQSMPKKIKNARIALLKYPIEVKDQKPMLKLI